MVQAKDSKHPVINRTTHVKVRSLIHMPLSDSVQTLLTSAKTYNNYIYNTGLY